MKKALNMALRVMSVAAVLLFAACEETDYLRFDTSHSGIYFTKDTLRYSFSVTPVEIKSYLFNIPVRVMGGISDKEREVEFAVRADSTTAEEGVHYIIGKAVIMPDSIDGYIPVTILRDNLEGNYTDGYKKYRLCIELRQNKNFVPTLDSLSQVRMLYFDNAIDTPEWFDYKNDKIWREGAPHPELGSWHPYTFIKLVEQFHTIADVLPETYAKMVAYYGGENLEKVPYASFYPYLPIMQKYVLAPLYEYFSNPDNREDILAMYPDYPFDFPNPYSND